MLRALRLLRCCKALVVWFVCYFVLLNALLHFPICFSDEDFLFFCNVGFSQKVDEERNTQFSIASNGWRQQEPLRWFHETTGQDDRWVLLGDAKRKVLADRNTEKAESLMDELMKGVIFEMCMRMVIGECMMTLLRGSCRWRNWPRHRKRTWHQRQRQCTEASTRCTICWLQQNLRT